MKPYYHKNVIEHAPLLLVPFSMGCGIGLSRCCLGSVSPVWLFLVAFLFSIGSLVVDYHFLDKSMYVLNKDSWGMNDNKLRIRFWLVAISPFFLGAALTQAEMKRIVVDWSAQPATFLVEVEHVNKTYDKGLQVDAAVLKGENAGKRIRLYLQGPSEGKVLPGNKIAFRTRVKKPDNAGNPFEFDYASYLTNHGISGTAFCRTGAWKRLNNGTDGSLTARLMAFRERLVEKFSFHFDGESMAVLAAMTLGNKTYLDKSTRELFAETGSSHILALSGLHVGILYSLFNLTVVRLCRRRKQVVCASIFFLACLWAFTVMCGMSPSLVRASFMMTVVQSASCFRRDYHCINSLSVAAIVMLAFSPLMLFDVSFQLSFAAVLCIALYVEYIKPVWFPVLTRKDKRSPYPDYGIPHPYYRFRTWICKRYYKTFVVQRRAFYNFTCISLAAQIGTLPLVVYYFHLISPYALLANYVVIPLAYLILGFAFLFFLVPFAQSAIAFCLQRCLDFLFWALSSLAALPGASIEWHANAFTLFSLAVMAVCYFRHRWYPYRVPAALSLQVAVFLALASEAFDWRPMRTPSCVWVYNEPRTAAVHFVSSARSSYLVSSLPADSALNRLSYVEENYWKHKHMETPQVIGERFANNEIMRLHGLVQFGKNRFLWLTSNKVSRQQGKKLALDVLIVGRGCSLTARQLINAYSARYVVLDSSLPEYRRVLLQKEFAALHKTVHDVTTQGAFCFTLDRIPS